MNAGRILCRKLSVGQKKEKEGKRKRKHIWCVKAPWGTHPGAAGQYENNSEGQAGEAAAAAAAGSIDRAGR